MRDLSKRLSLSAQAIVHLTQLFFEKNMRLIKQQPDFICLKITSLVYFLFDGTIKSAVILLIFTK